MWASEFMLKALLRRYPPTFRERYGPEVEESTRVLLREAWSGGVLAGVRATLGVATDLLHSIVTERRLSRMRGDGPNHRRFGMGSFGQDLRDAIRQIARNSGYATGVVLTLSLALGGVAAVFTLADPMLFRPLPYRDADRIVRLDASSDASPNMFYADYLRLADRPVAFDAIVEYDSPTHIGYLNEDDAPDAVISVYGVYPGLLDVVLGVQPAMGRSFQRHEHLPFSRLAPHAGSNVALITHGLWQRVFGGSPDVIGKSLRLYGPSGGTFEIIGVLPRNFVFPDFVNREPGALIPIDANLEDAVRPNRFAKPLARLKAGVSVEQASAEMQRAFDEVSRTGIARFSTPRRPVITPLRESLFAGVRRPLFMLLAVTGLVLLLAFANIGHLVMSRLAAREGEIASRQALGASPWRIARMLIVETTALATAGLIGSLLVGRLALDLILGALPAAGFNRFDAGNPNIYRAVAIGLDGRIVLVMTFITIAGLLLFGLWPALRAARADVSSRLQAQSSRTSGRGLGTSALVMAQITTAIAVLVASFLLVTNFVRLANTDLGYRPDGVSSASLSLPRQPSPPPPARLARLSEDLRNHVRTFTGRQVALTNGIPGATLPFLLGRDDWTDSNRLITVAYPVSSEFLHVFGLRLRAGRWLTEEEALNNHPVAVVDERTAALLWPGQQALGQLTKDSSGNLRRVVGVVATLKTNLIGSRFERGVAFVPLPKDLRGPLTVVWRGDVTPSLRSELGRWARQVEPGSRISARALDFIERQLGQPRFLATLLGALGLLAAALTLVGVYAVVSHSTARRTREIGIRMALGANRPSISRLVLRQTLRPAALGIALGLSVCLWWTQTIRSMLHGIEPADWRVFAAAALFIAAIVMIASWLPARRATRVDPLIALKAE